MVTVNLAFLDPYHPINSPVHRLDARVKLVVTLAFIFMLNVTPIRAWPAYGLYLAVIGATIALARVRLGAVLRRSLLALPFVLMAALSVPFIREGQPVITLPVLSWRLILTDVGLLRMATILARSWLSVLAVITLALTAHLTELVRAMRGVGVPLVLTSILLLMYRYLYVLVDEAMRLMRARDARTVEPAPGHKGPSLLWRARVTGDIIGTLFLRTYERSERIYQAMLARGFTGELRALTEPSLSRHDLVWGSAGIALLALVAVLANVYW